MTFMLCGIPISWAVYNSATHHARWKSMKSTSTVITWGKPGEAWAQGHQIAHHVDELVDLAWCALPVSPQRRRRADVLGLPARAHRVRHAGHGVHVGRENSPADRGMLVHGEGADPVRLVQGALPEELALQGPELLVPEPREDLLEARRPQGVRDYGGDEVREAVRPRVGHHVLRHGLAPTHQRDGQGAARVLLATRLWDDRLAHDVRGGVLGSVVVGHKVRRT
mmetsp:Transcript_25080/g.70309  ORF Transcript_25080/g.70309 Transcript_25080/m.70309 type:complete len:224 (-) Transcript_25080:27-698(-)